VLCKKCNYPELTYSLMGKSDIKCVCNACGANYTISGEDKAGKAIVNHLKTGGKVNFDINREEGADDEKDYGSEQGDD